MDGIIGCCPLVTLSSFPYSTWDGTSGGWLPAPTRSGSGRRGAVEASIYCPIAWLPPRHYPGAGGGVTTAARQRGLFGLGTFWFGDATKPCGDARFGDASHGLGVTLDLDGIIGCFAPWWLRHRSNTRRGMVHAAADWGYLLRPSRPVYDLLCASPKEQQHFSRWL